MQDQFASPLARLNFGHVSNMSNQEGEVFWDETLNMARDAMMHQTEGKMDMIEGVADYSTEVIGTTCVKIQDMLGKRSNALHFRCLLILDSRIYSRDFEPQPMTSFEGDTGAHI